MKKLTVAFRSFTNAPKNRVGHLIFSTLHVNSEYYVNPPKNNMMKYAEFFGGLRGRRLCSIVSLLPNHARCLSWALVLLAFCI